MWDGGKKGRRREEERKKTRERDRAGEERERGQTAFPPWLESYLLVTSYCTSIISLRLPIQDYIPSQDGRRE
jgi:hypothetical protein